MERSHAAVEADDPGVATAVLVQTPPGVAVAVLYAGV